MRVEELNLLRNDDLLNLARNPVANSRADAIRLLVERGSHLASHPDIATEAASMVYADPIILKKSDPASEHTGRKLPGLIDVLAHEVKSTRALEQKSSALEENHGQLKEALREKTELIENAHKQSADSLVKQIQALEEKHESRLKEVEQRQGKAEARVSRLERSLWRKIADWFKGR
jgi:SMC interacting uncharacterized protein involved in chromosome segregation